MQAFAKGANAPKPKKREPLAAMVKKPAAEEDTAMGMSDDGGDDDNDEDVIPKAQQVVGGKSRQERQEELRKMMEDDDDAEDAEDEKDEDEREDTPMEDVEEEKPAEPAAPAKDEGPSEVVTASSGDGRRRGKRRVMRKKMIEDKDGYLGRSTLPTIIIPYSAPANNISHDPGTWLGVLLGRRGTAQGCTYFCCPCCLRRFIFIRQGQEAGTKDGPGQHHVILWKEVKCGENVGRREKNAENMWMRGQGMLGHGTIAWIFYIYLGVMAFWGFTIRVPRYEYHRCSS